MKVLAIVGSSRKNGNTASLVEEVGKGTQELNADYEMLYLSDYSISDCTGCEGCSKTGICVIKDDMQKLYKKINDSDAIIIGSPTYFYNVTGRMKNFLDRLYTYEIFDDDDRGVWLSYNEVFGLKYAVTVAICEQEDISEMGVTSEILSKTLSAVGWRSVANIKGLHAFKKGEAKINDPLMNECHQAGVKLAKTVFLAKKVKENFNKY
ncbi:MAG: flavodoxin family protein [Spirochaetaceae bacterium]|nr:flavodoxin family protein [Spirochaetaceae bacterium]